MSESNELLGNVITEPTLLIAAAPRKPNSTPPAIKVVPKVAPIPTINTTINVNNGLNTPLYYNFQYTSLADLTPGINQPGNYPEFVRKSLLQQTNPGSNKKTNTLESSNFYITFVDSSNTERTFVFSLMPAIENSLRSNNTGLAVPEVKPGLSFRTDMNTKKINIPGARPVFQSLSIDKTIIQITAALIGNEEVITKSKSAKDYTTKVARTTNTRGNELSANTGAYNSSVSKGFDAWSSAAYIDSNIVQTGRPITLTLKSNTSNTDGNLSIVTRCLFQSFRYLARYQDRCYYSFDLLSLDYLDKAAINIASTFKV